MVACKVFNYDYDGPVLRRSAVDALMERFVSIDGGYFCLDRTFSEEQLKKLFEKCMMANKKVWVRVLSEHPMKVFDSTGPIDYNKYYSESKVIKEGEEVRFANEDKDELELRVCCSLEWKWCKAGRKQSI
uniref:DDE_Tnp_1 domain-containing protein n=1 Tax=Steinernema glaseri TaxID=37863 RepID=A0A1I7Z0X4_9BILA